jgi:hypothetical protein
VLKRRFLEMARRDHPAPVLVREIRRLDTQAAEILQDALVDHDAVDPATPLHDLEIDHVIPERNRKPRIQHLRDVGLGGARAQGTNEHVDVRKCRLRRGYSERHAARLNLTRPWAWEMGP